MNTTARQILESALFENKTLTAEEVTKSLPIQGKYPVFVTVYDGDMVVWSSGRIYPSHEDIASELIENTVSILSDKRFTPYKENHEKARKLSYRIDIFGEKDRRLLHQPADMDSENEGMILLCQSQEKAGIILPHMFKKVISGEDMYHEISKKINLDAEHLGKGDIILYGVKTQVFEDVA